MNTFRPRLFQIDAFAEDLFTGNPAAVCPLPRWLPDATLQIIATENNLSETAFFVPEGDAFALRWFTPTNEVELCGHATLASAFVLFECLDHPSDRIRFTTRYSGELSVTREQDLIWLDFPAQPGNPSRELPDDLTVGLGATPSQWLIGPNYMAVFDSEADVAKLAPDMRALARLQKRCVIATAPGDADDTDFVSRYFAPNHGIDEDPVTGSAHCMLAPYWGTALGKDSLRARQISTRGGTLRCELAGNRVRIGGHARLYLEGEIQLPENLI